MADAIFDIVSTGRTLKANGLREVESVLESEALLVTEHDERRFMKIVEWENSRDQQEKFVIATTTRNREALFAQVREIIGRLRKRG